MKQYVWPSARGPTWPRVLYGVFVLLLIAGVLVACQPAAEPEPTKPPPSPEPTEPPPPPPPTPTPLPDQSVQMADWESGPHANNYDIGKGPNSYCSRCHSPQNWDPQARVGPPPNCVTCKFPTDAELRIAETMDFVEEADWVSITCVSCHKMENDVVVPGLAWLNTISGDHEPINTPNELCQKCHLTTAGVMVTGGTGVTHEIVLGGSAHKNWAGEWPQSERPQYCSDCHNPHSAEPMLCVDCHEDIPTSTEHMKGLNSIMLEKVSCMACHDAAGHDVGPHPDATMNGLFVTQETTVGRGGPSTAVVVSHSIQWQVACDRCHFVENPWALTVLTAEGEVPEPVEEGEGGG